MKEAIIEGIKELARVALIAVIPVLLTSFNAETGAIKLNLTVIFATVVVAVLRAVDKWVHESPLKANGILPF